MRCSHAAAAVAAGTATSFADLFDQETLEARNIRGAEESINPVVRSNILNEVLDDEPDGWLSSEPAIERTIVHRRLSSRRHKQNGNHARCYGYFHLDNLH